VISYLVTAPHRYTMETYLHEWEPSLAARVVVLSYEEARDRRDFGRGTYVFADLERLSAEQRMAAAALWERLATLGSRVRLLNHPLRTLRRFDLLRALQARGVNDFGVSRLPRAALVRLPSRASTLISAGAHVVHGRRGSPSRLRFPVFVRRESEHDGSLTPLLCTWHQLHEACQRLIAGGHDPSDLLVVEFCDTRDADGVYRKYGAFVIGDAVVTRSLMFSRKWLVKMSEMVDPELLREEADYVRDNPHAKWLRGIARLAGIDYGRIDYAFRGDRPQIWEINTNPAIVVPRDLLDPPDRETHDLVMRGIRTALEAVDVDHSAASPARLESLARSA
jgi:hypothetical protein